MTLRESGDLRAILTSIPKAELHVHLEGTLEPEQLFQMAERNGVRLDVGSIAELRSMYSFEDLSDFLEIYYKGIEVLRTELDFYDLTIAYLSRAHQDGVVHAEIFFDPQVHVSRGVTLDVVLAGIRKGRIDAERRYGITSQLIMCILRDWPVESAHEIFELAQPFLGEIAGIGLDSAEVGYPPSLFTEVFARARSAGLRAVAHAGEEGPPEYIWEALDLLQVERIDHGIRALSDPALVAHLIEREIALTVCPLSNLRLKTVDTLESHPLKSMLEMGICVTINSDDPAYFGGYILDNYIRMSSALGMSLKQLVQCARNSIVKSFMPDSRKEYLLDLK